MKKRGLSILLVLCMVLTLLPALGTQASAASNPYPYWQTLTGSDGYTTTTRPCTYYAWQLAKERMGVELPAWGNAVNWLDGARNSGYSTGSAAAPNSIAVYSGGGYGHVAYVTAVNGNEMTVDEGGRSDHYSDGSLKYTNGIAHGQPSRAVVGEGRGHGFSGSTLIGFIYLGTPPVVEAYFEDGGYNASTSTISTRLTVSGASISNVTSVGVVIYDPHDQEIARKEEPTSYNTSYMNIWYSVGSGQEIDVALQGGTTYKYKYFVVINGKVYTDILRTFTPSGSGAYLDVNGLLGGSSSGSLGDYGTVDVYINGRLVADDVKDYYTSEHLGSTYAIKDIKAKSGYVYNGVASGSLTGTINGSSVNVVLKFDPAFNKDNNTLSYDYGDVFYAYIFLHKPWVHVEAAGGENGANVQLTDANASVPKQIWRFEETSDGSFLITNEYSGKALEVSNGANSNGANVALRTYDGTASERWFLSLNTATGQHSHIFTAGHCDLVMTADAEEDGKNIQIYTRNGSAEQNFCIWPLTNDGVTYVKPSRPAASRVTTTEAVAGTAVNINWTESALVNDWDARTYTLTVKDSSGNTVLSKSGLTGTSCSFTFPSAGTYTAQVTAVNAMYYDCMTAGTAGTITVKSPVQPNPFTDVTQGKFYYDPVLWAISQNPQITTGVTDTTFEPDRTCTRAHVVTFLWRANGCPNPANMTSQFKDVKETNKYYYKAVLWAAEQGITTGYSDGTFRPDDECTRGQVVTFLWRAKGQPMPSSASIPFTDVPAGKYYTTAVLWALQNNITQGRTSTTFGPDDACTRGHVVTFLYRAYA